MTAIPWITSVLFLGSLFSALNKKKKLDFWFVTAVITNGDVVYRAQEALNVIPSFCHVVSEVFALLGCYRLISTVLTKGNG